MFVFLWGVLRCFFFIIVLCFLVFCCCFGGFVCGLFCVFVWFLLLIKIIMDEDQDSEK